MKAIPCPISADELRNLVEVRKLTDQEIAALLPDGTWKRVQSWRRRFGIEAIPRWSRNEVEPIEGPLRSLLVGSMLGDGRLVRHVNATYYSERHCLAQKPYLEWKAAQWGSWAKPVKDVQDKRGYTQVRFETCAHADLNEWQALFYADPKKGWKRLVPSLVGLVDEYALAVWYMDDGCASWWPCITFGADEPRRQVALAIFEKFGLQPRWQPLKGKTGNFHFEREEVADRFLDLIRPHVPECMADKLGPFGFQGPHYQVRQKVTEEVLRSMALEDVPIREMARRLGVGATTVSRWLRKLGIEHGRKVGRPPKLMG